MSLKRFILPVTVAIALAGAAPASAQQRHGGGSSSGHVHANAGGRSVQRDSRPRGSVQQRRVVPVRPAYRGSRGPLVRTRIVRPFYRPFYAFRPHFSLGLGLFLGYPVAYPWDYVGLYPWDPYAYDGFGPYAAYGAPAPPPPNAPADDPFGTVAPGTAPDADSRNVGGISLDISPSDATVTVDGSYAGTVGDFSPSSAPLTLVPGPHHVVVAKPGFRSMIFDATIAQGQVLPYQGQMQAQ
jgi:PEGA domain